MSTITLPDGRIFPEFEGKPLSWVIELTWQDEQEGFPRAKAVIRAMKEHRPAQLEQERRDALKGSFDRMFGHQCEKVLKLIWEIDIESKPLLSVCNGAGVFID